MSVIACVPTEKDLENMQPVPDGVDVLVWNGKGDPPDGIEDVEYLLGSYVGGAPAENALATMPKLKVIQLLSAGVERWAGLVPDGVTLCNGRGVHGSSTAELAVTGILALTRELRYFLGEQDAGRWSPRATRDLDEKQVVVLGAGDIGRRAAAALEVFGAHTTYVGHTARDGVRAMDDVPSLLPTADILIVALPLTDRTRGMIDAGFLAALPDGAILATIARGAIIDTDALLAELTAERILAFLDVTDPEPLPEDHPLWHAPNVIITPHVGGGTIGWERRGYRLVREQLERLRDGRDLLNVVSGAY